MERHSGGARRGWAFALVQLWAPAGDAYRVVFGLARWPLDAAVAVATLEPIRSPGRAQLWPDATDLLALPALLVPVLLGRRASATVPGPPGLDRDRGRMWPVLRSRGVGNPGMVVE